MGVGGLVGVAVGGTRVAVAVGGTGVAVGGTRVAVAVGGTGVAVGGTGVAVGTGDAVGAGAAQPPSESVTKTNTSTKRASLSIFASYILGMVQNPEKSD